MRRALVWFRRDLRLADNPALQAALAAGFAPVPLYVHSSAHADRMAEGQGTRAWLRHSLDALECTLRALGSGLVHAEGDAGVVVPALAHALGVEAVFWNRSDDPVDAPHDASLRDRLRERSLRVETFNASLLAEPWNLRSKSGTPYRVFTPFWRTLAAALGPQRPLAAPRSLPPLPALPPGLPVRVGMPTEVSLFLADIETHWTPGERGAHERLREFVDGLLCNYADHRDRPDYDATSRLSPHLHFGELSPRQLLQAIEVRRAEARCVRHVDAFVRQLGWREFARHLLHHFPQMAHADLDPRFARFAWAAPDPERFGAWCQGRTGVPLVDAGMRQLLAEGWMHNRVRMVAASFLVKNLRMHWLHGARWFHRHLVDADIACNSMGWQWVAGTGADAAPYFRVFNPVAQSRRFDPQGRYIRRWVPELAGTHGAALHAPWETPAVTVAAYPPQPVVDLAASRDAALAAYRASR